MSKMRCCLCGKEMREGEGNNPWPVMYDGECRDRCNLFDVVPLRIELMTKKLQKEGQDA